MADFGWWSGLPLAQAKAALASIRAELAHDTIAGRELWRDPDARAAAGQALAAAHLIPPFDELLIAYKDRAAILDPRHAPRLNAGGGMISGALVLRGAVAGTWRRIIGKGEVALAIDPFAPLSSGDRKLVTAAAEGYARFLRLAPAITIKGRPSGPARSARDPRSRTA